MNDKLSKQIDKNLLMLTEFISHLQKIYEIAGDIPVAIVHRDRTFSEVGGIGVAEISDPNIPNYSESCLGILDSCNFDDIEKGN